MKNELHLRNKAQVILFVHELQGQISDGNWEDEVTDKRLWDCKVFLADDEKSLGCNFNAKYSLDFNDDFLVEVVGDRMLEYVRQINPEYSMNDLRNDLIDITDIVFGEK